MKNTTTDFNVTAADNGYIINKTSQTSGKENDEFFNEYTSETYVFTDWDEAIEWLRKNGK